jgi:hypothetical protein
MRPRYRNATLQASAMTLLAILCARPRNRAPAQPARGECILRKPDACGLNQVGR